MLGNITQMGECNLFLIPIDSDMLTMDLLRAFREYQLLGDQTCVYHAATAIVQLQVGKILQIGYISCDIIDRQFSG